MKSILRISLLVLTGLLLARLRPTEAQDDAREKPDGASAAQSLNIALVLDVSLSMDPKWERNAKADKDPLGAMQRAVFSFLGALDEKDSLALISFAGDAVVEQKLCRMDRDALSAAARLVRGLKTREATNYEAALRMALQELSAADGRRVVLFLTDGTPNRGAYEGVLSDLKREKISVFAVGFEGEEDWNRLKSIAAETEGVFYQADETNLPDVFGRVQAKSRGLSELLGHLDFVRKNGDVRSIPVRVPEGVGQLRVFLSWAGSDRALELSLEDPNGQAARITTAGVQHDLEQVSTARTIKVQYPAQGEWKALVTAKDIPAIGETFRVSVQVDLLSPAEWTPFLWMGKTVRLAFTFAGRKGGTMEAKVANPQGGTVSVALNDDGAKGDDCAADGVFSANFPTRKIGIYRVTATIPSAREGENIEVVGSFSCGTEEDILKMETE